MQDNDAPSFPVVLQWMKDFTQDDWKHNETHHKGADRLVAKLALWLADQPPLNTDDKAMLADAIEIYRHGIDRIWWYE